MITISEIAPSPPLTSFIRCYRYREFDTKGSVLINPWHASHEVFLIFHFKDLPVSSVNTNTGQVLSGGSYGGVIGLGTQYNGCITLNGCYSFLEIAFKPNGFHAIFGLPLKEVNNSIIYADDILDSGVKLFFEQLSEAGSLPGMAKLADAYLLHHLKKQKSIPNTDVITSISNSILKSRGNINVDQLAYNANMSIRNFERRFIEQIGISPKLFCCINRFNYALSLKLKKPFKSWMAIVNEAGYFDQMHLIKDFKRFSGSTPAIFLEQTPLSKQTYTNRYED